MRIRTTTLQMAGRHPRLTLLTLLTLFPLHFGLKTRLKELGA